MKREIDRFGKASPSGCIERITAGSYYKPASITMLQWDPTVIVYHYQFGSNRWRNPSVKNNSVVVDV
jgi:hypothetical protein